MSFNPYSSGTGIDHSEITAEIIANSATINVGDAVKINTSGFITNAGAGAAIFGVVIGFFNSMGYPVVPAAYALGSATGTDVTQVVAASDNQTNAQKKAIIESSIFKKWSAQVNGTLGSTNASGKIGARIDTDSTDSNYDRVLESTATRTDSTIANWFVWGLDPNDSTRVIVSIAASQKYTKAG